MPKDQDLHFIARRIDEPPARPVTLPPLRSAEEMWDPRGYIADAGLVDAVNIALRLRRPLLLTGEPGTGKTRLAYSLAHQLGWQDVLRFDTKSGSKGKDLFYSYDALARLQDQHLGRQASIEGYIRLNALGLAIALANPPGYVSGLVPSIFAHNAARASVVLIDEIDKAPRDFPNDILGELEELYFQIPELGGRTLRVPTKLAPVVILTSNSERNLPDAFLRRCVFYDIPFPDKERLQAIVQSRLADLKPSSALLDHALEVFKALRDAHPPLQKPPGTAELLDWLCVLRSEGLAPSESLQRRAEVVKRTLPALVKTRMDRQTSANKVDELLSDLHRTRA